MSLAQGLREVETASLSRTKSGGFQTSQGTIYVSKAFTSGRSKKLKAAVKFIPRVSHFDTTNELSGVNEFRGFFALFWLSMFLLSVRTYVVSFETTGSPLNFRFATMFSQDALTLALSDVVLVGSTVLCVPFAKAVSKGWIKYYWLGVTLQHTLQTLILFIAVTWTFNRQWPWVQSGFLTMHSLVMIMKMHSYMTTNGYLQSVSVQSDKLLAEIKRGTEMVGGWDQAIQDSQTNKATIDGDTGSEGESSPGIGTPDVQPGDANQTSYVDATVAATLRKRLNAASAPIPPQDPNFLSPTSIPPSPTKATDSTPATSLTYSRDPTSDLHPLTGPHPLVDHPNEQISSMAKEYSELQSELISSGPEYVKYPENITYKNFALYQLIPTLVYELEYPRTNRIRPLYIAEKTAATFGTFALLYTVTESLILPLTPTSEQSFFRSLLDLALPFMIAYLLLFYIIFECICNAFAELSYFADREFYQDWWNSTSWDEFARKWNKPVHTFLLRHVYAATMSTFPISKTTAMFITFLLSACAHELVMAIVTQKFRMYLFVLQIVQIPLIAIGNLPAIKRNKTMGNIVFWFGLFAGFPLLCVAYVAY